MVAVDTLLVEDLERIMEFELVCHWCEAPAEYMWRHDNIVHFNCAQCAHENEKIIEEIIFQGGMLDGWCAGCRISIDIIKIKFVKI